MMTVNQDISNSNPVEHVAPLLVKGYRFVTITVADNGEDFDVVYHFDLNYELFTLKLNLKKGKPLQSISKICFPALLVENEIQDLFGITIEDMLIDYNKLFILSADAPVQPMCRVPGVGVEALKVEPKKEGGAL